MKKYLDLTILDRTSKRLREEGFMVNITSHSIVNNTPKEVSTLIDNGDKRFENTPIKTFTSIYQKGMSFDEVRIIRDETSEYSLKVLNEPTQYKDRADLVGRDNININLNELVEKSELEGMRINLIEQRNEIHSLMKELGDRVSFI